MKELFGSALIAMRGLLQRIREVTITIPFSWTGYTKPMNKYRYFSDVEVQGLDQELCAKLDLARAHAGIPFVITSGFRTPADNERVMGIDGSAHCKGLAVDLRCDNSPDRYKMVTALLGVGFNRIGIYQNHIHCDTDQDLPNPVMWYSTNA